MSDVAVVGLGAMGSRIARRLVDAGHELVVWNRTPDKAAELVGSGATLAESPAAAAREAEVVITMVADPEALRWARDCAWVPGTGHCRNRPCNTGCLFRARRRPSRA